MDVFRFRDHLTRDYAEYVRSFIRIGTPDVKNVVDHAIDEQLLWPEPIVQLHPSLLQGAMERDLVPDGSSYAACISCGIPASVSRCRPGRVAAPTRREASLGVRHAALARQGRSRAWAL